MNKRNKGFTLIELLVVIAIIGILASIVLASLNSARRKSRDVRRIADLKQIQLALEMYFDSSATRSYPTTLGALVTGGQIPSEPKDPINSTPYSYAYSLAASPTYYHLGASLEEGTNPALNSDRDCNSLIAGAGSCPAGVAYMSGFNGGSGSPEGSQKCNPLVDSGSYCYDLVP